MSLHNPNGGNLTASEGEVEIAAAYEHLDFDEKAVAAGCKCEDKVPDTGAFECELEPVGIGDFHQKTEV